ncbi:phenylalanine--tRNA ligase beta subunit-related protein [Amycolatopsis sp. lyj-346]|uniref:phenylalanine--tRNA ligase beta subunit-related protein n=1 Tax=Amycolatopsis sp. lyj-346 TaxID=2789289 RepID=UPI00397DE5F7
MTAITMTERLRSEYPGFTVCWARLTGCDNRPPNEVASSLVDRFPEVVLGNADALLAATAPMNRFFKTLDNRARYHIRSLVKATINGRAYRGINPAVDLLYTAELETGTLMSMHDAARLRGDLTIDVNAANRTIEAFSGDGVDVARSDIVIHDESVVVAAVAVGISRAASVGTSSTDILVFAYGCPDDPPGQVRDAVDLACERMQKALAASVSERGALTA